MAEYTMPKVYKGQMVIWYAALGSEGSPAIVTRVGTRQLCVAVFSAGFQNASAPDGVLHVSDPNADRMIENEAGFWDYTDGDKDMQRLMQALQQKITK